MFELAATTRQPANALTTSACRVHPRSVSLLSTPVTPPPGPCWGTGVRRPGAGKPPPFSAAAGRAQTAPAAPPGQLSAEGELEKCAHLNRPVPAARRVSGTHSRDPAWLRPAWPAQRNDERANALLYPLPRTSLFSNTGIWWTWFGIQSSFSNNAQTSSGLRLVRNAPSAPKRHIS